MEPNVIPGVLKLDSHRVGPDSYEVSVPVHAITSSTLKTMSSMDGPSTILAGDEPQTVTASVTLSLPKRLTSATAHTDFLSQIDEIKKAVETLTGSASLDPDISAQIYGSMFAGIPVTLTGSTTLPATRALVARLDPEEDGEEEDGTFPTTPDPFAASSGPADGADYKKTKTVSLQRTSRPLTGDVALWLLIKLNADMLSWNNYVRQIDLLFFPDGPNAPPDPAKSQLAPIYPTAAHLSRRRFLPFTDTDAYRALKVATEAFVVTWGGVAPRGPDITTLAALLVADPGAVRLANERLGIKLTKPPTALVKQYFGAKKPLTLPYLQRVALALQGSDAAAVVEDALEVVTNGGDPAGTPMIAGPGRLQVEGFCGESCLWLHHWNDNISAKLTHPPLIELIWSYWMEELQLVQTMNAVARRFQNVSGGPNDPLNQLEMDPLRPLNNMIWGWVQDEQHRLPIERRAAEYRHEYGFRLFGRAVPRVHTADNRSKFLEAFHTLLNLCVPFFRQADDTTVVPDGFPLLNALREVHLILSEGAHNQFRDLPTTSRIEMMMQQWLLARPEFREFLPRRAMVAYPEPWMHSVEGMRKLQGWGDTNTYQFWQLATTGEQIVSSIRWGDWNSINDPVNAANWATFFRPEIQTYIHSYRAVTGIDVSAEPVDVQVPGMHLLRRLRERKGMTAA